MCFLFKRKDKRTINLWDTAGQEGKISLWLNYGNFFLNNYKIQDYEQLRTVIYPGTDVFILCYSIAFPDSLKNSKNVWFQELKKHAPGIPIILCGTKSDLRDDFKTIEDLRGKNLTTVTFSQGKDAMKEIGAISYLGKLINLKFLISLHNPML